MAQMVKILPEMQKIQILSLSQEDVLEKEMVTHSSILSWRIPWIEKPGGLQSMGSQREEHNREINAFPFFYPYKMQQDRMCWKQTRHMRER